MERLTFDGNFCDIAQCRELPCKHDGECAAKRVWERLKEYENTIWTPEMLRKLNGQAAKMWDFAQAVDNMTIARLKELTDADKDGRVVVLPCKVGDTVWRIVRDGEPHITRDEVRDMYFADDMTPCIELVGGRVTFTEKFGKTVFLTREEAERAMEGMENGNETSL